MKAVTQWFPPEVKPVHVGFYQRAWRKLDVVELPDYFDGKDWFNGYGDWFSSEKSTTELPWRGLADKPSNT